MTMEPNEHNRPNTAKAQKPTATPAEIGKSAHPATDKLPSAPGPMAKAEQPNPPAKQPNLDKLKLLHVPLIGQHVYRNQLQTFARSDDLDKSTLQYISDILTGMKPRDAFEEMLIMQALWTHNRVAQLSSFVGAQKNVKWSQHMHDAADRASNTFRRLMLALAEYRRPPRSDAFMAIKQANLAQQQVVQNVEKQISQNVPASNEKGLPSGSPAAALPSDASRPDIPSFVRPIGQALATSDRAANG
jgi:hypothetical protein